jgi:hypothetical protein
MSKKHFEAIAKAIRHTDYSHCGAGDNAYQVRLVVASNIAGELAALCPNFEAGRFIRACTGVG